MYPYQPEIKPHLQRILRKLVKKNQQMSLAIRDKMEEIVQNPHHYTPLGNVMSGKRRVHFGSFVLVFSIDEECKRVVFEDFDHHDKIYLK